MRFKLFNQRGQVIGHSFPKYVVVEFVVSVRNNQPGTLNRAPRNLRRFGLEFIRNMACGFAYDLNSPVNRKTRPIVAVQVFSSLSFRKSTSKFCVL